MLGRKPVTQSRIIDILEQFHLLSAPQILEKMSEKGLSVNKTSIYRALDKLLKAGTICKHTFTNDILLYELRDNHHDHFVCERCGTIDTIECQTSVVPLNKDYQISHHHVTLFGICPDCKLKTQ